MKNILNNIHFYICAICLSFLFAGCEDYLDKAPESNYSEKDIFGNFRSFQGFIEQMHGCIADPDKCGAWNNYLFADEILNTSPMNFDLGNYWGNEGYFYGGNINNLPNDTYRERRIWEFAWYAIAAANTALEKIEEPGLFSGTDEEKRLIKGQALYFRGWFYFEICRFWGGMPYVARVLSPSESFDTDEFVRLNFQQTALKMAEDFRAAADLLPNHWDDCVGEEVRRTVGNNRDRINKFMALGYLGKALLYAASPMINEEATGVNAFDPALCARAADAFGELLKLATENPKYYSLEPFSNYMNSFQAWGYARPGLAECIVSPTIFDRGRVRWSTQPVYCPNDMGLNAGNTSIVPTHNIIQNYGMANGLPINHPMSGYDPGDPWANRDPRFYQVIAIDGDKVHNFAGLPQQLATSRDGYHRRMTNATATGYYMWKFSGLRPDLIMSMLDQFMAFCPFLRLAEVYLFYAEAVNFQTGGGPKAHSSTFSMTAEEAINMVRNRAQLPNIIDEFTVNKDVFFEEIVRERAVELIFEGARFCDLRRWNRNFDPRYLNKTAFDFDRDPATGKPVNWTERTVITRVAEKKHNWLPIQVKWTTMFWNFPQNPGW